METIEMTNNRKLEIKVDESPDDPRGWDNFGTLICFHKRYDLGDKHEFQHEIKSIDDKSGYEDFYMDDPKGLLEYMHDKAVIKLPVYMLDHSGLRINTGGFKHLGDIGRWDSGQIGYIFVPKEKVLETFGGKYLVKSKVRKALDILKAEIETYDSFVSGSCFYYVVTCTTCGEQLNCLGTYYGSEGIQEIKSFVPDFEKEMICKDCNDTAKRLELVTVEQEG